MRNSAVGKRITDFGLNELDPPSLKLWRGEHAEAGKRKLGTGILEVVIWALAR
jgi:hypothetical protein